MGSAVIAGGLAAGVLTPPDVAVLEPDAGRRDGWAAQGLAALASARQGAHWLGPREDAQVLLAVKPQMLAAVGADMGSALAGRVVISVLAGTPGERVRAALPGTRVVRAMPNLAARLRQSATAVGASAGASESDTAFAEDLFRAVGTVVRIDEALMNAFTALAGSGPAYVFYLAQAMTRTAEGAGFGRGEAVAIVRQTVAGAAALLAEGGDPARLQQAVTSKGGTTEAAIAVLAEHRVGKHIGEAIVAAMRRGEELGA